MSSSKPPKGTTAAVFFHLPSSPFGAPAGSTSAGCTSMNDLEFTFPNGHVDHKTAECGEWTSVSLEYADVTFEANTPMEFSAYNNGAVDKATRKKLRGFKK